MLWHITARLGARAALLGLFGIEDQDIEREKLDDVLARYADAVVQAYRRYQRASNGRDFLSLLHDHILICSLRTLPKNLERVEWQWIFETLHHEPGFQFLQLQLALDKALFFIEGPDVDGRSIAQLELTNYGVTQATGSPYWYCESLALVCIAKSARGYRIDNELITLKKSYEEMGRLDKFQRLTLALGVVSNRANFKRAFGSFVSA